MLHVLNLKLSTDNELWILHASNSSNHQMNTLIMTRHEKIRLMYTKYLLILQYVPPVLFKILKICKLDELIKYYINGADSVRDSYD